MNKFQLALTVLDRALTTKRPHGHDSTVKFCAWLLKMMPAGATTDGCGNIHFDLRGKTASKSLFVAHVDTVHRAGGKNKVTKTDKKWYANGAPLGADDGAGVALLMHMIHHKVPGYYIFTQGEEVGGIGASWLADNLKPLLAQFSRAIAFDRRATYSVITHQAGGRCASDEFGDALSDEFNKRGMLFATDDGGVYTDTAEFVDIIPECTNISAGYDMEHTANETLDMDHFMELAKAVIRIEWDALPTVRNPMLRERKKQKSWWDDVAAAVPATRIDRAMTDAEWARLDVSAPVVKRKAPAKSKGTPVSRKGMIEATANEDKAFMEAMDVAMDGSLGSLVAMMAKAVDPQNPRTAEKMISRRLMSEGFLCQMYDDSFVLDLDTLLVSAFQEVAAAI